MKYSDLFRNILIGQGDLVETYECTLRGSRNSFVCSEHWSQSSDTHQSPVQTCWQFSRIPLIPLKRQIHKHGLDLLKFKSRLLHIFSLDNGNVLVTPHADGQGDMIWLQLLPAHLWSGDALHYKACQCHSVTYTSVSLPHTHRQRWWHYSRHTTVQ